jgi:hypothetical protein
MGDGAVGWKDAGVAFVLELFLGGPAGRIGFLIAVAEEYRRMREKCAQRWGAHNISRFDPLAHLERQAKYGDSDPFRVRMTTVKAEAGWLAGI